MPRTNTNNTPCRLLAVDRNVRNLELLAEFLSRQGYQVSGIQSIEAFEQALGEATTFDLALVDVSGFDRRIWESCEQLRNAGIPFLLLSSRQSHALQQQGRLSGAYSLLIKPLVIKDLLAMIDHLLRS